MEEKNISGPVDVVRNVCGGENEDETTLLNCLTEMPVNNLL